MSKLIKLKKWLSLEDAANHLSSIFAEPVRDFDIIRFALDGHIKLSLNVVNPIYARPVIHVDFREIEYVQIPIPGTYGESFPMAKDGSIFSDERGNCQILKRIETLGAGLWTLLPYGSVKHELENLYQEKTGGPEVSSVDIDGDFMIMNQRGDMFMLVSHYEDDPDFTGNIKKPWNHASNFYPTSQFPTDAILVVTTQELNKFIDEVSGEEKKQKPLANRERETLLIIIAALAKEANIPIERTSKAGEIISNMTQLLGSPVGATTVERHIKMIPEILSS